MASNSSSSSGNGNGFSGLMGNLNDDIAQAMQSPLFNLGTALIAGAQPGANPGLALQSAAQTQQAEQQQAINNRTLAFNLQAMQGALPLDTRILQALGARLGGLMGPPVPQGNGSNTGKSSSKSQKQPSQQSAVPSAPVIGPYSPLPPAASGGLTGTVGAPAPSGGLMAPLPGAAPQALGVGLMGMPAPSSPASGSPASGGIDPMMLMSYGAVLSGSPIPFMRNAGAGLLKLGQMQAQYDPAYATRLAAAKSTLAQDQALYAQAQARGDQLGMQAARMKYLTDSKLVGTNPYNNSLVTFGGITPQSLGMSTVNPRQGTQTVNGVESPIPGAPQTQQALAAAQSLGRAAGETVRVYDPTTQTYRVVPRSWVVEGAQAHGAPTASGATATGPGFTAAPGPQQEEYLAGTGREGAEQVGSLQEAANAAKQANFQLDQILADSRNVLTGPLAGVEKWKTTATGALEQMFGVAPPKSLATYQELDKYANQVAFAASRQLGSREAAQIVTLERESNPNKSMVPQALRDLVGAAHSANDYVIAQNQYTQTLAQRNGGNAEIAQAMWTSNTDPRVWELAVSPELAAKWAPQLGLPKVAKVMPFMGAETAYNAFRNLPRVSQQALVKRLDPAFMQEMADAAR